LIAPTYVGIALSLAAAYDKYRHMSIMDLCRVTVYAEKAPAAKPDVPVVEKGADGWF
jgi:hypothetical protein